VRLEFFPDNWILHHDNAPSHTVFSIKEFLAKKSVVVLEHPTYQISFCMTFHFPTMKNHLKGSHFEIVEQIQKVTMAVLNNLQENDFWNCFDIWKQRWNSCITAGRKYFEGGHCSSE
jgi:hypothetical protein